MAWTYVLMGAVPLCRSDPLTPGQDATRTDIQHSTPLGTCICFALVDCSYDDVDGARCMVPWCMVEATWCMMSGV